MKRSAPAYRERRRHPRRDIRGALAVELRLEVSGENPAVLLTRGLVDDLSCGGLKCDIALDVPIGTRVDIRFPDLPREGISPELVAGRVVRVDSLGGVPDAIAIAFARPLDVLDFDRVDPAPALAHGTRVQSSPTPC